MIAGRVVAWVLVLGGSAALACVLPADIVGGTGDTDDASSGEAGSGDDDGLDEPAEPCGGLECTCGAPTCHQTCATAGEGSGGCLFGCDGDKDCHFECTGGACHSVCTNGADCQFDCIDGSCTTDCTRAASCTNTCDAGSCHLACDGTDVCELACAGGGCTLDCNGASTCRITECTGGCVLNCGGATTCHSSCALADGCVTRP